MVLSKFGRYKVGRYGMVWYGIGRMEVNSGCQGDSLQVMGEGGGRGKMLS